MTTICRHAVLLGALAALPLLRGTAQEKQPPPAVSEEEIAKVGSLTYAQLEAAFEAAKKKSPDAAEDSPAFQRLMLAEVTRSAPPTTLLQPDSGATGQKPNKYETALLLAHPEKVPPSVRAFKRTEKDIKKEFGGDPLDGTPNNAVKHAYWNALLTKYTDEKWAGLITTAHEADPPKDKFDHAAMDLHNNRVGREVASRNKKASEKEMLQEIRKLPQEFVDVKGKTNKEVVKEMDKIRGLVHIRTGK